MPAKPDKRGDGPTALAIPTRRGAPDADDWGSDQYMGYCGCFWESAGDNKQPTSMSITRMLGIASSADRIPEDKVSPGGDSVFKVFKVVSLDAKLSRG